MSRALFNNLGGLRFWSEGEIMLREQATQRLVFAVKQCLRATNPAWQIYRCETPILTPENFVQDEYIGTDDLFELTAQLGDKTGYLRPETTAGSYAYMDHVLQNFPKARMPLCVWQIGKSFRRETNDGASASKLRFNEFHQLEFQCLYAEGTKADYRKNIRERVAAELVQITNCTSRTVPSDRLPKYSSRTDDIELVDRGNTDRWVEACSISTRTDNKHGLVLEIAIGMDRVVSL